MHKEFCHGGCSQKLVANQGRQGELGAGAAVLMGLQELPNDVDRLGHKAPSANPN